MPGLLSAAPLAGASDRTVNTCLYVLVALLAAPLFFRVGGPSLIGWPDSASVSSGGINVPVGAVLAVAMASWVMLRGRQQHAEFPQSRLDNAVLLFAAVAFVVLVLGLLTRPGPYNVLYFGQAVLPLAAYYVVSRVARTEDVARGVVKYATAGAAISGGLMLIQALVSRGPARMLSSQLENHVGPLNIYQSNDYVPFVFAIVFLVALHKRTVTDRLGPIAILVLFGLGVVALASYARGPVFLLIFGTAALAAQTWWVHRKQTLRAIAITAAAFGVAIALSFPSTQRVVALVNPIVNVVRASEAPSPVATIEPKGTPVPSDPTPSSAPTSPVASEEPAPVDQPSNDTRTIAFRVSTAYLISHPIYGGGFAPIPTDELSPILADAPSDKLFPAHNQYLDFGLRGGVPLIVAYLGAMILAASSALRIARWSPNTGGRAVAGAVLTALAAALLVGNLYQNNFTQPYPAFLMWALIGLVAGLDARRR